MAELLSMELRRPPGLVIADTYRVLDRLGGGGMGEVYAAEHVRTGKPVAVKLLRSELGDDDKAVRRFQREARALAAVHSEHVVSILDCGTLESGAPYLVMERLHGRDLRALLGSTGPLPIGRALHIALDACRGLSALHATGLVHRDLKPANLFITEHDDGRELCKILDLGVAKLDTSAATHQGAVIGTIRYMAPEQLADSSSVGPESDIYALGAILYESLTGAPAHAGDNVQELMFNILNHDPLPPSELVNELPVKIDRIVARAMARDPAKRFADAKALAKMLSSLLRSSERPQPDSDDTGANMGWFSRPLAGGLGRLPSTRLTLLGGVLGGAVLGMVVGLGLADTLNPPPREVVSIVRRASPLPAPANTAEVAPNIIQQSDSMGEARPTTVGKTEPELGFGSTSAKVGQRRAARRAVAEQSAGIAQTLPQEGTFGGPNPYADGPAPAEGSRN
jgi:serine/threonine-protein kinase